MDHYVCLSLCPLCNQRRTESALRRGGRWTIENQGCEEAGVAWDAAGCGAGESPEADSCPFACVCPCACPWRISCARFWAACIAALGGDCLFFGLAASATILYVFLLCKKKKIKSRGSRKRHTPFELTSFLIRFVRDGALEDRAE